MSIPEETPADKPKKEYKRRVKRSKQKTDLEEIRQRYLIVRFIMEVHYLEELGRVSSRAELEERIGMAYGGVGRLRLRKVNERLNAAQVSFLAEFYNADLFFIFKGFRRPELAGNMKGPTRLSIYEPYVHAYAAEPNPDLLEIAKVIGQDLGEHPLGPQRGARGKQTEGEEEEEENSDAQAQRQRDLDVEQAITGQRQTTDD